MGEPPRGCRTSDLCTDLPPKRERRSAMNAPHDPPLPLSAVRLTPREIEVLSLIAQGYSSKDASDLLFVSKRTIDGHLASVYGKLGVNNRVKAFRAATRLGLIPHEPTAGNPYVA